MSRYDDSHDATIIILRFVAVLLFLGVIALYLTGCENLSKSATIIHIRDQVNLGGHCVVETNIGDVYLSDCSGAFTGAIVEQYNGEGTSWRVKLWG